MDVLERLAFSAGQTAFESAGERAPSREPISCGRSQAQLRHTLGDPDRVHWLGVDGHLLPIYMASAGGRRMPLLKAMLTTACERHCLYCPFRAGRHSRRVTFKPEAMAQAFSTLHGAGLVDGVFLSSGVFAGGANTQNRLLDTAEILRHRLGYRGYLHLKIMPGAEKDQVRRAMQLADRVSINLEGPSAARLLRLAPEKQFYTELLEPLEWIEAIRQSEIPSSAWGGRWPSSSTQFVVGPAGESDRELLSLSQWLYRQARISRSYYEAFSPVPGTPFENLSPEQPLRQDRLYQASYLLRDYGFDLEELPFDSQGRLPLQQDPKRAYAELHLRHAPLELNRADPRSLLRVPGIGKRGLQAIMAARRQGGVRQLGGLQALGIAAAKAAPYLLIDGRPASPQAELFNLPTPISPGQAQAPGRQPGA
jgi:predicted DNA-binding helix-hairpin-helix protein